MVAERAARTAPADPLGGTPGHLDPPTVPVVVASPFAEVGRPATPQDRAHWIAVVDTDDELVAVTLGWLRAGLAAGDLTVATVDPELAGHVRTEVPGVEVTELGDRTPREPETVAFRLGLLRRAVAEGRSLRILGQVQERDTRAWDERVRSEAAHHHVFADQPVAALCVYDRRTTPPPVLAAALSAHPELVVDGRVRVNAEHLPPSQLLASLPWPVEPLQAYPPVLVVDDAPSLPELRHRLAGALRGRAGSRDAEEDFHLAASEIAANAFRHGGRPVSARLWASPDRLVCNISDGGTSYSGELAGYRPAHGDDLSRGGMGLWLARKLCDHVDLQNSSTGLTVRLSSAVRP